MEIAIVVLLAIIFCFFVWDKSQANRRWKEQGDTLTRIVSEKVEGGIGVFGEVRERLGELTKRTKDIEDVGKSIASLQEALRTPKFRGEFGEEGLERLLSLILPPKSFSLQYEFKNGKIVDAIVRIGGKLVPIDSKFPFPLEDFRRMVTEEAPEEQSRLRRQFTRTIKKHIDDISNYILVDENTFDFALMYIPAENIYYETIIRCPQPGQENDVYSHCLQKRVFPVSPNSFYAYLQAIALGLKGLQIEKSAQEILGHLQRLQHDFNAFQEDYDTLGGHIRHASVKYDDAARKLTRLSDKLQIVQGIPQERLPEGSAGDGKGEAEASE